MSCRRYRNSEKYGMTSFHTRVSIICNKKKQTPYGILGIGMAKSRKEELNQHKIVLRWTTVSTCREKLAQLVNHTSISLATLLSKVTSQFKDIKLSKLYRKKSEWKEYVKHTVGRKIDPIIIYLCRKTVLLVLI